MPILNSDKKKEMESLNALFKFATEGIIITDKKGIITKANPSAERLFGYYSGELVGKTVENLIPDHLAHKHHGHREMFNKNPHSRSMGQDIALMAKRKDGTEFPVEISLTHFVQDEQMYVVAFIIDISERLAAQEKIKRVNIELEQKVSERTKVLQEALKELEQSKEQLSKALDKEKELNDLKSRFVTMASHEFRTPLSTILSSVSLISKYKTEEEDTKRSKHVDRVKSAVTNMTLILNDFLSAEKLETGKIASSPVEFDLKQLVSDIINELSGLLKPNQKIDFTFLGSEFVYLDKQMMRNIFINLISNAIKFSLDSKIISLFISNEKHTVHIEVKDQGIGIPKEEQKNLFERFYRAKNATNIQGTGLGLSIVAKYIEEMKGKIDFTSELNLGTTFTLDIPYQKL
ncbi:MAG TPA: PAS domain-containing sensor histidine kinase [Bacteroidia bacterium]|nr:PAS domain-containing sensor histidine kinase [Bacteroidia bacterium]HRD37503.1 PAS domain-containing sensor histidine kinase [Bacteroidia bacterium]